ncbi:MAG: hypothetical protein HY754_04160 [Nitrospirae bacterium]|nr:hypothetical protein [Nitrospirota bacterium]
MNNVANSRRNAARAERLQQKVNAGFVDKQYPEVASIVISMSYNQRGILKSLPRIVNFFPSSYALFRVDCLSKGCTDGGFDLSQVITSMIRNRRAVTNGKLNCEGNGISADHSDIIYEVTIQYT